MAVKAILRIGNPFLQKSTKMVNRIDDELREGIIQDMLDTMKAEDGAGIAAPQIGVNMRIVIFGVEHNPRYPDAEAIPMTILINPQITTLTSEVESAWEGCLSVPGFRGLVPRYKSIRYTGRDENGGMINREVSGFHARVVQHEVDHLNGILYPEKIKNLRDFGMLEELEAAEVIPKVGPES